MPTSLFTPSSLTHYSEFIHILCVSVFYSHFPQRLLKHFFKFTHTSLWVYSNFSPIFTDTLLRVYSRSTPGLPTLCSWSFSHFKFIHTLVQLYSHFSTCFTHTSLWFLHTHFFRFALNSHPVFSSVLPMGKEPRVLWWHQPFCHLFKACHFLDCSASLTTPEEGERKIPLVKPLLQPFALTPEVLLHRSQASLNNFFTAYLNYQEWVVIRGANQTWDFSGDAGGAGRPQGGHALWERWKGRELVDGFNKWITAATI